MCNPLHHLLMPMGGCMDHTMTHAESETRSETALEILKKRYARGEISRAQFEEMKKDLAWKGQ